MSATDQLREAIRADGRAMAELCELSGVNPRYMEAFMAGTCDIDYVAGRALARLLGHEPTMGTRGEAQR